MFPALGENATSVTPPHLGPCSTDNLAQKIAKISAYGLILLIGLIGNSLICFIFYKNKNLRKTVNYFIFNMTVSDLLVPVFVVPKEITNIWLSNGAWLAEGPLGLALCKVSYFVQDLSFLVSILSLLFMAFERFVAIVFPMRISTFGVRVRAVLIALTWVTAMAVHAPYFYTFRLVKNEMNVTTCRSNWEPAFDQVSTQRRYGIATFTIFVIVPFGLLVVFYSSIGVALRRQNTCLEKLACERARTEKENRRFMALSVVIVIGFALCYVPFNIYVFVYIFGLNFPQTAPCGYLTFYFVADFLARSASVINPCTCFVFYRSYRNSLRRIMLCSFNSILCRKRPRQEDRSPWELSNRRRGKNNSLSPVPTAKWNHLQRRTRPKEIN